MTLKINDSGTWKEPTKVSVKDGGAWKEVLTASVKDGGSWKPFYQRKYTYTVSSNVNKLDLDTVLTSDQKLGDVDVVINSGVYVYSDSTGTPALLTGNGVAGVLTIINNGYIYGAGGSGGLDLPELSPRQEKQLAKAIQKQKDFILLIKTLNQMYLTI